MNNHQRNSLGERNVEQAITALKRGSYLLKYGRRGKPKFCPFRLSTDETRLIWYVGKEEKELQLSQVSKIIPGQRTANFQRFPRPEKEYQSFSLLYGKSALDLVEILTQRSLFLEAELGKKSRQLQEKTEETKTETDKNNAAKEVIKSLMTQVKGNTAKAPQDGSAQHLIYSTMTRTLP
ncbi:unnamed protein product [Withania somnifera]